MPRPECWPRTAGVKASTAWRHGSSHGPSPTAAARRGLEAAIDHAGDLAVLDGTTDAALAATGGRGGHEVRCWIAALAALGPGYAAQTLFYEPVDAWITGMGVLTARPA